MTEKARSATERWLFVREYVDGRWSAWSWHSLDLVKRIMTYGLPRGRIYQLQTRPGAPCVEYRTKRAS